MNKEGDFSHGEIMKEESVVEIASLGYGNPEAKISYKKKLENGEFQPEVIEAGVEVIKSGSCMVDITDPDDGCIDGRLTMHLLMPVRSRDKDEVDFADVESHGGHHSRYKVAGGGYITSLVMKLALDPEVKLLDEDLNGVAKHLTEQGIFCGTHTGGHIHDEGSVDCGANDKLEQILRRGGQLTEEVKGTISYLTSEFNLGVSFSESISDRSEAGLVETLGHPDYFAGSNGKSRFNVIMNTIAEVQKSAETDRPVSVSKHLGGDHNEAFIVLNTVKGKTFSQAEFQHKMLEKFPDLSPDKVPQAFVVDIPRIVDLAEAMAKGRDNEAEAKMIALYAGIAFQFAVAAELTDGTLRSFIVQ